ncbi:DUF3667 domain-containing protein [Phenylobacterium sp.]|jgi:hypothetical protein|uniref:DUF3667 domain-containing protein n=1 Tax=Phenylobacterium sp. TaxID=1871053 RepID=UPI002E321D2A|nr:DUF3667 domain-containing protein [Phenylobacterium sp.]HEX2560636.1 DUF3667 domain-containing protein [Phenylobacterium sp.]
MTATADTVASAADPAPAHEAPPACRNCGAQLGGKYCQDCGQQAHLHGRLVDLLGEMFEGVAHFDGRLWRTLPLLALRPGELSRRWKAGERARFVPPLHVFLFAVFLVFTLPYVTGSASEPLTEPERGQARARVAAEIAERSGQTGIVVPAEGQQLELGELEGTAMGKLHEKSVVKLDTPEERAYFRTKYMAMAYKLAWVLAPLSMLILALLMAFRRGYTLYDHGVVSLYGLGFFGLMVAFGMLLPEPVGGWWGDLLAIVLPLHAMAHLKGAYGLSWTGASLRSVALGGLSLIAFALFMTAVFAITAAL